MAKRRRPQEDLPFENDASPVPLQEAARSRYLNYALSVITSRALPDVRDGLKPVQRRILFTMGEQGLRPDSKHRKCASVVGTVMAGYHPHGEGSIYDALVRLAQPFTLREPLVDGSGNFGSMDGDAAAAMRYTECRTAPAAGAMLSELGNDTVDFRANYDGTKREPIVLPAKQPNLLINGATGIAVGLATNIPPHNPIEVCEALLKYSKNLKEDKETRIGTLCAIVRAPDFPTGGQILNTAAELEQIYVTGAGAVRVRATHVAGETTRSTKSLIIDSVPYGQNKAVLVERIAEVVTGRKLPPLLDVRDLSADDVHIELVLQRDADERMVLAYLYKNTPLQQNFNVNMTCLVPTANPEIGRPERCDLKEILWHFLKFRMDVVRRRLENELGTLRRRLHILDGFALVFDALDEIIAIIRKSEGKADAKQKIMARFKLDDEQTEAILELKLYRLARLEINIIHDERTRKRERAKELEGLLSDESARWDIVRAELLELRDEYAADPRFHRRTRLVEIVDEPEYSADDFIVAEDNVVIVTQDGWIKRQREVKSLERTKIREGDRVLACEPGSTRATIVFFSSFGVAYTSRIDDVAATTGHGEPIQKRFALKDGEHLVAAMSLDPRWIGDILTEGPDGPPRHALAVTTNGFSLRFGLGPFVEPSTKSGRRYARPTKGASVVGVALTTGTETILAATRHARAMVCPAASVNFLSGAGKGVRLIKLGEEDSVLGFIASKGDRDLLTVETNRGAEKTISTAKYEITGRGGRGREIQKNGHLTRVVGRAVDPPAPLE